MIKRFFLSLITVLSTTLIFAQTNFQWEQIDSVKKSKTQIYSDTKMFIAEYWKSAQDVIQNDDKEGGVILVKGLVQKNVNFMGGSYTYNFKYNVIFRMKENKYKININDVVFESAYMGPSRRECSRIDPFDGDNCPETGTFSHPGISKSKAIEMIGSLRQDLDFLIYKYMEYIKSPSKTNGDW